MKKIKINEESCLGCHLCEYYCAYANSCRGTMSALDMAKTLKGKTLYPRIRVEDQVLGEDRSVHFAVNCRQCPDPICVKSCISGALTKGEDGVVRIDRDKCVGCETCVLVCPFGAILPTGDGPMQKCEMCLQNAAGTPACVANCPGRAIVLEEV